MYKLPLVTAITLIAAGSLAGQPVITTVAGADWVFQGDGGRAVDAPIGGSIGLSVAIDSTGSFYIADADNSMIMKVDPDGILTVVAGNGLLGNSGDGGLATDAALGVPLGVAVDEIGNVYVADYIGRIRKVAPNGIISTIAGAFGNGFSGDGGPATRATFDGPSRIAVDRLGNVYVMDRNNARIRKINTSGIVTTFAGTGQFGYSGDGGPATQAAINPFDIATDINGNLYIAEAQNARLRKVTPDGVISTIAGGGMSTADGIPATQASVFPFAVGVDKAGNIFVGDFLTNSVRKIDRSGVITTIAGKGTSGFSGDNGPAISAELAPPRGIAVDDSGNVYIADGFNNRIRRVDTRGQIDTVAGNGRYRSGGNGGPAVTASLYLPHGILSDRSGNLYICEPLRNRVRRVAPDGTMSIFAGTGNQGYTGDGGPAINAAMYYPTALAMDARGDLYVGEQINGIIRRIALDGTISTFAGTGALGFSGDGGPARRARFGGPTAITFDKSGNLFVADASNHRIRKIAPDGTVTTAAGNGQKGYSGDDGPALQAALSTPSGIAVDESGNLFIADTDNHRIRKVAADGTITTIAGNGRKAFAGDGGPAVAAALDKPIALVLDSSGNVYVADQNNHRIRRISADGIISTVAGSQRAGFAGDGGPAIAASLGAPAALTFDRSGNLLISDTLNYRIRAVLASRPEFRLSESELSATAPAGTEGTPLSLALLSSIPGLQYSVRTTDGASWLRASPEVGIMPAAMRIMADATGLAAGTYNSSIEVTAPHAAVPVQSVPFTFTVVAAGPARLAAKPTVLTFSFVEGSVAASQVITVENSGGGKAEFRVTAGPNTGRWLRATPQSASATASSSASITVTADPAGLRSGTYSGVITIGDSAADTFIQIPVNMTVSAVSQRLVLPQSAVVLTALSGRGASPLHAVAVQNAGQGVMAWSARATTISGGAWLSVSPASGASEARSTNPPQLRISANPANLEPGTYYGRVDISAPSADNGSQFISVVLNVLPPGTSPGPIVQPTALLFTAIAGADSPSSQTITVSNVTGQPLSFSSGRVTLDGASWFATLPDAATVPVDRPSRIVVQPDVSSLNPGVYRGSLTLAFSEGSTRTIRLLFIVIPPSARGVTGGFRAAQADCIPAKLVPEFTSLTDGLRIPAGWPNHVEMRVIDDCANAATTGTTVASFSNGDPPLSLIPFANGRWVATWQARAAAAGPVTVTGSAEMAEPQIRGTVQVTVAQTAAGGSPPAAMVAVMNAASRLRTAPLSPGSLISIRGTRLSVAEQTASGAPLPLSLASTSVVIAGRPAPLLYVSEGEIRAQVPFGLPVNTTLQAAVASGTSITPPETLTIAAASPAVFTTDGSGTGQGMIYIRTGAEQKMADETSPAAAGEVISILCTGLGEVSAAAAPGAPAASRSIVNPITVTIGGVQADVLFAGLAADRPGYYEVTARVPERVVASARTPVILSVAGQASPAVTMAIR